MTEKDIEGEDPLAEQIDENLRKVFQRTLEEDVPDKFMDLLSKLKDQDQGSKHGE
ncbi:NepR family anti-sigma factor [Maritimibacter sp. UBA3975]|uniref:NepR family anti-sigma factor n=1 Tax=Maritimibacter sp. UBA3975 TaxID=1946833 RepID=UPI0025BC8FAE|nr:NepR family anti-sigma factor [Maritimibacter sp. UBA3975]